MTESAGPTDAYWDHTEARMVSRPPSRFRSAAARAAAEYAARAEDAEALGAPCHAATLISSGPQNAALADVVGEPA